MVPLAPWATFVTRQCRWEGAWRFPGAHQGADCRGASAPVSGRSHGAGCGFHSPINHGGTRGGDSASSIGLHQKTACGADMWNSRCGESRRNSWRRLLQERTHRHIVEQRVAFFVQQIKKKIVEVFQALLEVRFHDHFLEPSFSRSAVLGSRTRVNLAVTLRRELLAAAMARA